MDWMISWDSLDDRQRMAVNDIFESTKKFSWIHGFAGSGKTIILLHIIKRFLLERPSSSICFVTYTLALTELALTGLSAEERNRIVISTLYQFKQTSGIYDLIIVDEVQDSELDILQDAAQRATYKLVIAGDASQQIYTNRVTNEEIKSIVNNVEEEELRVVHRLTDKIKKIATSILPSSRIMGAETPEMQSFLKRGADAYLYKANNESDEVKGILLNINENPPKVSYPYGILFPNHDLIKKFIRYLIAEYNLEIDYSISENNNYQYYSAFNNASKLFQFFGNGIGSLNISDTRSTVYLMTYHSAKGFDFEKVFLPFANKDYLNSVIKREGYIIPDIDRKVLYVAVTRSKNDLIISYNSDEPHPYIKKLVEEKLLIEAPMPTQSLIDNSDDDEFF